MPTNLIFLRHGQSVANAAGRLSGWEDVALTPEGEAQALAAGAHLRALVFGRVLVSDLGRAIRTAELALMGLPRRPMHILPELRERHMGVLQGEYLADLRADGRSVRYLLPWDQGPPGGETHARVVQRALACLRAWDDGTPTLVVAHGSLIRNVVGWIDGLSPDAIATQSSAPNAIPIVRTGVRLRA